SDARLLASPALPPRLPPFPTRRSSDLTAIRPTPPATSRARCCAAPSACGPTSSSSRASRTGRPPWCSIGSSRPPRAAADRAPGRSEEHTSELQSHLNLVCRLLLEKKKK